MTASIDIRHTPNEVAMDHSDKVGRFIRKLLAEVHHLQADHLSFVLGASGSEVGLYRERVELRKQSLVSDWFPLVLGWLRERKAPWDERHSHGRDVSPDDFHVHLHVGATQIRCRVEVTTMLNGRRRINLSRFQPKSLGRVWEEYALLHNGRQDLPALCARRDGVIVVCARDDEALRESVSVILSASDGVYGGIWDTEIFDRVPHVGAFATRGLVVCGAYGDDPLEVVSHLGPQHGLVAGVLALAVVRRVCAACAREAVVEERFREVLPDELRPEVGCTYRLGRGCSACAESGFSGVTVVESVVGINDTLRELLSRGVPFADLLSACWSGGYRPLLGVGVEKAMAGVLGFDDLFGHVVTLPAPSRQKYREVPTTSAHQGALPLQEIELSTPLSNEGKLKSRQFPLVLVVEDDPDQRSILEMVFRGANYQVQGVGNGAEAIAAVEREMPDVIVTDLMMPVMDGAALIAHLKGHPVFRKVPVLVLTVVSDSSKEYDLLTIGADDYCEKTTQRKILLRRVDKLAHR